MCSIIIGYKNWWSNGHPKRLGQMNRGILVTCGNQYCTSNVPQKFKKMNKQYENYGPCMAKPGMYTDSLKGKGSGGR